MSRCSKILVISACLLGQPCRYDGSSRLSPQVLSLTRLLGLRCHPLCPEVLAGLPVPRLPAEICGGDGYRVLDGVARVRNSAGEDVTSAFLVGAERTLAMVRLLCPVAVVTKERSPSCGKRYIYDGSFSGLLRSGPGVTTAALLRQGVTVFTEEEMAALRNYLT
ncbi:MAG: DUF523 domain-containing protein [Moorellales bacterium]